MVQTLADTGARTEASFWQFFFEGGDGIDVKTINSYAVLMGYLSMAIKGLGILVLTWTTVVLLGGFVSILHRKDFWCLTFITLVQTAGIFDVNMNEKLGYMGNALRGLLRAIALGVIGHEQGNVAFFCLSVLILLLMLLQVAVLAIILGPLAIIYVLGIFISGVIALWRLIEHDYGGNSDGEASNLAPAMDALYYLALLQGVLLCYRFVLGRVGKRLSKYVANKDSQVQLVLHKYLRETKKGCEKNPAFAQGRNLITSALDKIGSNYPLDFIDGLEILYAAICMVESQDDQGNVISQHMLLKHIILSASSSQYILQKLLEMLDSRGIHGRKTRRQAAMVVERLAMYINLEQFPRGIQHVSSLIGTFEQYSIAVPYNSSKKEYEQHLKQQVTRRRPSPAGVLGKDYKKLFIQGLSILRNLAADENNCRVMSDTRDLISKIMAPVTSDLLNHTAANHGTWYEVVDRSMEVMCQLTGAQGETGAKLRRHISSCGEAISTLQRILSCESCTKELKQRAIWILTRLYMDTIQMRESGNFDLLKKENNYSGEGFVRMLVNIFTRADEYSNSVRGYAGEALSGICFLGGISDATVVIQTSGDVVDRLTQVHLEDRTETCRQAATEILEHLCTHYTKDDEYLGKLKKAIIKVIGEMFLFIYFVRPETDIKSQCDATRENNEQDEEEGFYADSLLIMSTGLLSSLLSLCGTAYDLSLIIALPPQLDGSGFLKKLEEIVYRESYPTINNLSLCKATGKMVISMMKYYGNSRFFKQEDFGSLIEALSRASENMLDLDYSVVCSSASSSDTRSKLDRHTLVSLVREAKQVLATVLPSTSLSG